MSRKNSPKIITNVKYSNDSEKLVAVIDSGTMITFSSTCLMNVFRNFVIHNKIKLLVSNDISNESVWKPISNKRFSLNAARIKHLFNQNMVDVINSNNEIRSLENKILNLSNNCFYSDSGPITIIQRGEAEALALSIIFGARALFIDERTTRSLIENPLRLKQVLEKRQKRKVFPKQKNISEFRKMFSHLKVFRSIDVIALAYEQNLFDNELDHGKLELEAALYATKFAGCAVSEKEIIEYLQKI
jgi:hypothetical protein